MLCGPPGTAQPTNHPTHEPLSSSSLLAFPPPPQLIISNDGGWEEEASPSSLFSTLLPPPTHYPPLYRWDSWNLVTSSSARKQGKRIVSKVEGEKKRKLICFLVSSVFQLNLMKPTPRSPRLLPPLSTRSSPLLFFSSPFPFHASLKHRFPLSC